jgi:hypothetical protein
MDVAMVYINAAVLQIQYESCQWYQSEGRVAGQGRAHLMGSVSLLMMKTVTIFSRLLYTNTTFNNCHWNTATATGQAHSGMTYFLILSFACTYDTGLPNVRDIHQNN